MDRDTARQIATQLTFCANPRPHSPAPSSCKFRHNRRCWRRAQPAPLPPTQHPHPARLPTWMALRSDGFNSQRKFGRIAKTPANNLHFHDGFVFVLFVLCDLFGFVVPCRATVAVRTMLLASRPRTFAAILKRSSSSNSSSSNSSNSSSSNQMLSRITFANTSSHCNSNGNNNILTILTTILTTITIKAKGDLSKFG